ncbi:MAG: NAD-dependent DNA ligase LigA [Bacteroidetes bacterium]|nr:NAD-dependent DNA ligase LigA [Bacteroidota bacterium]
MYQPDVTKRLQALTQQVLGQLLSGTPVSALGVEDLRSILRFHEYRYYLLNDPLISDAEYDQLYNDLVRLEKENPELITPDSPTQRVAKGLGNDFQKVQHLVPMLSLENSYNEDDLRDWDRKAKEATGLTSVVYCVEPKFDGAGISLIYENDRLVRAATRGDGTEGEDITTNIRQIHSIPLSAAFGEMGIRQIEIRGEVLMTKEKFIAFNQKLAEENLPPLANPRNAASGTLRLKDPKEVAKRNLEAFVYHIGYLNTEENNKAPLSHSAALEMLWLLGFRSPEKEKKVFNGIEGVIQYCLEFEAKRDTLPYEIDGMVIKVNDLVLQEKMGMTTHHPRWAIAYKFKARQATSSLRSVEFQVGRTGAVTPVAKIDPVPIGGVTVSSISLHNEDFIREKNLLIGDRVLVERAGDVIPYIVKSFPELRTGSENKIVFPTACPVCNDPLYKSAEEAVWRCVNINCKAQVIERIIHFNSKDAMDIRGLGESHVQKFNALGFLNDIPSIYQLPYDTIAELDGYGKKSVDNLKLAIEASKSQPLYRLIYAMGIRFVGEATSKTLAHSVNHILELKEKTEEELMQLEDIGPKVAASIRSFFGIEDNINMLKALEAQGVCLENKQKEKPKDGNLTGLSFLFTGTLPTLKRNDAEAMVEAQGGKILGSVSTKLNYLVVGEDAGSKLEKAKKLPTIKIISEAEFLKLIAPES